MRERQTHPLHRQLSRLVQRREAINVGSVGASFRFAGQPQVVIVTSIDTGATWTYSHRELTFDPFAAASTSPVVIGTSYASVPAFMAGWISFTKQLGGVHVAKVR